MKTFDEFRTHFFEFYTMVKEGHDTTLSKNHGGHGLDHDVTVAMLATIIAPSERIAEKAWCAAMLHSVDRVVVDLASLESTMVSYSKKLTNHFKQEEIDEIVEAALRHGELNQSDQNETQVVLMDADRLANMQSAVIIRGGQFRSTLPVFEFTYLEGSKNPDSTYDHPQSILDNLRLIISQYMPQLRSVKAQELGGKYSARLASYIASVEQDYKELGLVNIEL